MSYVFSFVYLPGLDINGLITLSRLDKQVTNLTSPTCKLTFLKCRHQSVLLLFDLLTFLNLSWLFEMWQIQCVSPRADCLYSADPAKQQNTDSGTCTGSTKGQACNNRALPFTRHCFQRILCGISTFIQLLTGSAAQWLWFRIWFNISCTLLFSSLAIMCNIPVWCCHDHLPST